MDLPNLDLVVSCLVADGTRGEQGSIAETKLELAPGRELHRVEAQHLIPRDARVFASNELPHLRRRQRAAAVLCFIQLRVRTDFVLTRI